MYVYQIPSTYDSWILLRLNWICQLPRSSYPLRENSFATPLGVNLLGTEESCSTATNQLLGLGWDDVMMLTMVTDHCDRYAERMRLPFNDYCLSWMQIRWGRLLSIFFLSVPASRYVHIYFISLTIYYQFEKFSSVGLFHASNGQLLRLFLCLGGTWLVQGRRFTKQIKNLTNVLTQTIIRTILYCSII